MTVTIWTNDDGLPVRFGTLEATAVKYGEYNVLGAQHVSEHKLEFGDMAAFGTTTIVSNEVFIPKNARIEKVQISVEKAFVGATATLTLGLIQEDRSTLTGLSATGLVNAVAVASLVQGAVLDLVVGSTGVGALVGVLAPQTVNGLLTTLAGTATFTAGIAKIRVFYSF